MVGDGDLLGFKKMVNLGKYVTQEDMNLISHPWESYTDRTIVHIRGSIFNLYLGI